MLPPVKSCFRSAGLEEVGVLGGAAAVPVLAFSLVPLAQAPVGIALGWALLVVAIQDIRTLTVPTVLIGALTAAGLAATGVFAPQRIPDHVAGVVAGLALLAGVAWAYRRLRARDGLGEGDVLLLGCAGAWVGWQGLPSVVLLAAASALLAAAIRGLKGGQAMPFAPFLGLGLWLVWLLGPIHA